MKQRTEADPFISMNLRAFIEAQDPYDMAVVLALVFWHWWKDENDGLGIEGICKLGKMRPSKAKEIIAKLRSKGWIEASRSFGGKTKFRLVIPKMTFTEAYSEAANWLSGGQMEAAQLDAQRPPIGRHTANYGPPHGQPNIKRSEEETQTKAPDSSSPEKLLHRQAIGIFKKLWETSKKKKYVPTGKDHGNLKVLLQAELAPEYFEAKVRGYLADKDPFNVKQGYSLSFFCSAFNKWPDMEAEEFSKPRSEMEGLA